MKPNPRSATTFLMVPLGILLTPDLPNETVDARSVREGATRAPSHVGSAAGKCTPNVREARSRVPGYVANEVRNRAVGASAARGPLTSGEHPEHRERRETRHAEERADEHDQRRDRVGERPERVPANRAERLAGRHGKQPMTRGVAPQDVEHDR